MGRAALHRASGPGPETPGQRGQGMGLENGYGLFNHVLIYSLLHYLLYPRLPFSVF